MVKQDGSFFVLQQSKMRATLEELRQSLGVPPDEDTDYEDFGYRSTLRPGDVENMSYDAEEINVPVSLSTSPPRSAVRTSPPRSAVRISPPGDMRRPPLPRLGARGSRQHSDSVGTTVLQDSVEV